MLREVEAPYWCQSAIRRDMAYLEATEDRPVVKRTGDKIEVVQAVRIHDTFRKAAIGLVLFTISADGDITVEKIKL